MKLYKRTILCALVGCVSTGLLLSAGTPVQGKASSVIAASRTSTDPPELAAELTAIQQQINTKGASAGTLEQVQKVVQKVPNSARAHQIAGEVYEWLGYSDLADEQYREADRLDPARPAALIELFTSMLERGDLPGAYQNLFYMQRRFPNDPTVMLVSAMAMKAKGKNREAEQLVEQAVRCKDKPVGVDSLLGSYRLDEGKYAEALALAKSDLQRDPSSSNGNFVAGQALLKMNRVSEGIDDLRKAYRQKPFEKSMNDRCSKLFMNNGYYSDALVPALCYMSMCTEERELDTAKWRTLEIVNHLPKNEIVNSIQLASQRVANTLYEPRMHMSVAHVLDKTPYRDLAISEYEKGVALSPNVAKAYYRLGHDYECTHQYEKALSAYKTAVDKEPTNQEFSAAFARFLMRCKNRNQDLAWQLKDFFANAK